MISQEFDMMSQTSADNLPAGTIRCGGCGTVGYQSDRYCPCCGIPLVRSCQECGAAITHPIAYYCTSCGAMLGGSRPAPEGSTTVDR